MNCSAVVVSLALIAAPPPAALSNGWVHWQAWRPIDAGAVEQPRLIRVALPIAVYGSAQPDLADVRVIDDSGAEVPFIIDSTQPPPAQEWSDATLSDNGFVPGRYTQVVADVGAGRALHNTLRLAVPDSEGDFFEWVAVDASDDRETWRVARERAPIFRFRADGLEGQQAITFPQTYSRWLRVRILDGQGRFPIDSVSVSREVAETTQRQPLPATVTRDERSPERKSWWDADLNLKAVPVTGVSFTATQPAFHRPVTVSVSDDGASWSEVAQGAIYRESGSERLFVEVSEGRGRYWRVTIFNRDDAPIEGLHVSLLTTPQYAVFRQMPGRSYFVIYGNSKATAPEYDFATLTTREQRDVATAVAAGAESKNAAYRSPEPWTEQHGWLLWVALLAAVVVIGGLAIRSMQVANPSSS
jgi:hypothetical protein